MSTPAPVLLVVAAFSRHDGALAWGRERLQASFGPIALSSPVFPFDQTNYYTPTMGADLRKQLLAFRDLAASDCLPAVKLRAIELEQELARAGVHSEPRPLNLDPGVLCLGKFLLASTKDQAHRVYLRDGIFAEVTLAYQHGAYRPWQWTYADYSQPLVLAFLQEARNYYRGLVRRSPQRDRLQP